MPTFLFSNPYNPDGDDWTSLQKITSRVSPEDWQYLHRLCGYRQGSFDKVISSLFHSFIHELRNLESSADEPFDPAFCSAHPTEHIIAGVLSRCNFRGLPGGAAGDVAPPPREGPSPQLDSGTTNGVHPTVRRSTLVRSVQESGSD